MSRGRHVDREHVVGEGRLDAVHPRGERVGRDRISTALRGNTLAQFSERQNAQEQLRRISSREKRDTTMIRAGCARLRDDIGVEKIAGHKWSKLDGTAGVAVALDRELIDLGPT